MLLAIPGVRAGDGLTDFLAGQTRPVTVNSDEEDVATLLKALAQIGRFDLILPPEMTVKVSVRMKDVPLGVALARVLELGEIEASVSDGVLLAYPKDGVRSFRLKHAPALRLQPIVTPFLSGEGKVSVDTKTNTLIVQDAAASLNRIQTLLAQLDRRPRQVSLEAAILSTKLDDVTNLGVSFNKIRVIGNSRLDITSIPAGEAPVATNGLLLSFFRPKGGGITTILEALQQTTDFKVLSHPRLQAQSGESAEIRVGESLGFLTTQVSVGGAAPETTTKTVEFLQVGTSLKFTAHVTDDGEVDLELKPVVSEGAIDANGLPSEKTSQMTTRVKVASGQTIILGGLIRTREEVITKKVPFLGSIPLLGALFRSRQTTKANDEIVVLITPVVEELAPD